MNDKSEAVQRLIAYAHEMEELDRECQNWPEQFLGRRDIIDLLHDAALRLADDLTKILDE